MNYDPRPPFPPGDPSANALSQEAARCVACGLCLPHCPTYRKTLNEADSPRGRIFMMAAVLEQKLPLSQELIGHLELCLTCRACENACPSQVRYGRLVDGVRALIEPQRVRPLRQQLIRRILFKAVASPRLLQGTGWLLRAYQRSGLQGWARKSRLLDRFGLGRTEAQLPVLKLAPPLSGIHPAQGAPLGTVGLFLGCIARMTDAETLAATIFVLNRLGYTVHAPRRQTCCGALHGHNGEIAQSGLLAQENRAAFAGMDLQAIVHAASGCGAALAEYEPPLAAPVLDISAFLAQAQGWDQVTLAPLAETIAVHEPCSSRNVLHDQDAAYRLLQRIPGATVSALPGNDQCCGAAGIYALTQPEMAGVLLRDKIDAFRASGARFLVTSNPGCAMHIATGLRAQGREIEVLHPVSLIARQMGYTK